MRILVTGERGYIGTVLTSMLVDAGHAVTGLDTDLYERCTFGTEIPDILSIRKDIRDAMVSDLKGFDAVVHLAALSNDPPGESQS
jgi:nucleoside-diphosphate-sugar epimerase